MTEGLRKIAGDGRHRRDPAKHGGRQRGHDDAPDQQGGELAAMCRWENTQQHQRGTEEQA